MFLKIKFENIFYDDNVEYLLSHLLNINRDNWIKLIERKKPRKRKPRIGHRRVSGIKVYENHHSNAPRSRGGISKALEKYTTLAQDASSNGDRILAENFFQYAEHYQRLLNEGVGFDTKKNNNNSFDDSHKNLEEVKPSRTQRAIDGKKERLSDINFKEDRPTNEKGKKESFTSDGIEALKPFETSINEEKTQSS